MTKLFAFMLAWGVSVWATASVSAEELTPTTNSAPTETPAQLAARLQWWSHARFGMFIHWGLYSGPAGTWHGNTNFSEWVMEEKHMPVSEYEKYAAQFNPTHFDARAWVHAAKEAGAKYIVVTSKHHDGFAMYPTKMSDWSIRRTPFGRDPLKELSAACQAEGIKFCLYYTIMDWHSPDWGARRPWNDLAAKAGPPNMDRFEEYMKGQLKELLTWYGPIGLLWFDGNWESPWTAKRGRDIYEYVRSLQPAVIVNNRVGKPEDTPGGGFAKTGPIGDYGTPEQTIPPSGFGPGVYWESCMTMNDHWGFNPDDQHWKSTKTLVRNLIDCASKGGNYLLNVGPTSEGLIPGPSLERLKEIGQWMDVNGEAIYGTAASPFSKRLPWGRCTMKEAGSVTTLFLHVFDWPTDGVLVVPGLENQVRRAYLLADPSQHPLSTRKVEDGLEISVPVGAASSISTTVVLQFKGAPKITAMPDPKTSASNVYHNDTLHYGAENAFDGSEQTRWATDDGTSQAWVAIDFPKPQRFSRVHISEAYAGRVRKFEFQYRDADEWKTIFSGTTLGADFEQAFAPVTAREFRLNILVATQGPTINEVELER